MKKKDNHISNILNEERKKVLHREQSLESISNGNNLRFNSSIESAEYAEAYKDLVERVIPNISVRDPETFAFYGSAQKYYENSFSYIQNSYPYDGSGLEKIQWSLSASAIDLAVLQHEYPKETGHVRFSPSGWGTNSATSGRYGLSSAPEYISFSGGPYIGTSFDSATGRESGLKINPSSGNTVEFWLKKDAFVTDTLTQTEVLFDSHTIDYAEGNESYGRFLLELSASSGSPIYLTYMSGTAGFNRLQLGQSIDTGSIADGKFHHYAVTVQHTGSNLIAELYIDGAYNDEVMAVTASIDPVTAYFKGTIGALATAKDSAGALGYGKLSGSLDEFRFWKERRTPEQIGNYYDFPVNGATDKESKSSVLGVYYKFNEGIASSDTTDKVILDYSGRLNNGEFIGYSSTTRTTESAITLSTATTQLELGSPIIISGSTKVTEALTVLTNIAEPYDRFNNSSIFKTVPQWAYEPKAGSSNLESDFSILLQAIASKFDSIKLLIDGIPKIGFRTYGDFSYAQGSVDYNENFYSLLGCGEDYKNNFKTIGTPEVFSVQNLASKGFDVSELPIINKVDLNEYFYNLKFNKTDATSNLGSFLVESKADLIKDKILNSVYVNLHSMYTTKGTNSSFRNLIRCYGVDEKLIAPNVYMNNVETLISDDPIYEETEIKSLAITEPNTNVTLYQTSSTSLERHYIEGRPSGSMTFETKVIFPYLTGTTGSAGTTSIFGSNQVTNTTLKLASPNYSGFSVVAEKSTSDNNGCYFKLSSSAGIFTEITSEYQKQVFENTPWHLAVKFTEETSAKLNNINNKTSRDYKVEFSGHQYELDVLVSSFSSSATISQANFRNFIKSNKNVYIGAKRQHITGALENTSEAKFLNFSVWDDYLEDKEIKEHAKSADNIGRFLTAHEESDNQGRSNLRMDSLALHWQFDNVTYNASTIEVEDHTGGSAALRTSHGNAVGYKYPAVSTAVSNQTKVVEQEFLNFVKYLEIDNLYSKSQITIKEREIDSFELDSRPISYMHSYEKSMYQVISREMLKMLAGVTAFNNLIGEPIYKYRQEYKSLQKLRERFFSKVNNDVELETFIEHYKWLDSSLGKMLQQLQPATTSMKLGLEDVVESHALERNKYKHQAPVFEFKDPKIEGQILGINELLYDWEHGHRPLSGEEQDNCLWWQDRAERDEALSVTGAPNDNRETLRQKANTIVSGSTYVIRKLSRPYKYSANIERLYEQGSNRNANKNKELYKIINSGKEVEIKNSDIYEFKQCDDVLNPQEEKIYSAKTNTLATDGYLDADSDMMLPFSLYSSSVGTNFSTFKNNKQP